MRKVNRTMYWLYFNERIKYVLKCEGRQKTRKGGTFITFSLTLLRCTWRYPEKNTMTKSLNRTNILT
jgi:hypothetical protein